MACHEFASLALAFLAREFSGKVLIGDQESVAPLLRLLASADPDVQKNCIECIFLLLQVKLYSNVRKVKLFNQI